MPLPQQLAVALGSGRDRRGSGSTRHRLGIGSADEYRLTGAADVEEVLDWARQHVRADQRFVVYAECGDLSRNGLVRLWGEDPNAGR